MSTLDLWEYAARAFEPSCYRTPHDVQAAVTPHAAANPAHLQAIDEAMADVLAGGTDMLLVSLAPQEGKSERVIRAGILWWLHHRPSDRVIVASFEKTTAERWGRTARNDIEAHPELGLRLRRDSRAAARWDLAPAPDGRPGGSLFCVGVGGPITGKPADLLLIDDPVKGRAFVESHTYRQRQWEWWLNDARTRMGANTKVIAVMTRWHEDDLFGRLLASPEGHRIRVLNLPALAEPGDPLGRPVGQPLDSVRGKSVDWYTDTRDTVGPYVWGSLYQGHPTPSEGGLFRRGDLRYWHPPATPDPLGHAIDLVPDVADPASTRRVYVRDAYRFLTVDLAASTKTSADWTVASAWGLSLDGDLILFDRVRARVDDAEHGKLVEPLARTWAVDWVGVEDSGRSVNLTAHLGRVGLTVRPLKADVDKITRALPASARSARHQTWLPAAAPWLDEWVGEMLAFPGAAHDDQVDTLAYAARAVAGAATGAVEVPAPRLPRSALNDGVSALIDTNWSTIDW